MQEITLVQGLLISIVAAIVGIDYWLEAFFIFRPIIVSTLVGWVLGDITVGLITGGMTELIFAGLTPVGGTQPPNPVLAGVMATVLAYINQGNVTLGVSLALPFSILMQYIILFCYSTFSFAMKFADEAAENADTKKIAQIHLSLILIIALLYFTVVFLSTYLAQDAIKSVVTSMPEWLSHAFSVIGGVLPAIGFGMLLKILLKMNNLAYFILGFILVSFAAFNNLLPLALIGFALALINYYTSNSSNQGEDNEGI